MRHTIAVSWNNFSYEISHCEHYGKPRFWECCGMKVQKWKFIIFDCVKEEMTIRSKHCQKLKFSDSMWLRYLFCNTRKLHAAYQCCLIYRCLHHKLTKRVRSKTSKPRVLYRLILLTTRAGKFYMTIGNIDIVFILSFLPSELLQLNILTCKYCVLDKETLTAIGKLWLRYSTCYAVAVIT